MEPTKLQRFIESNVTNGLGYIEGSKPKDIGYLDQGPGGVKYVDWSGDTLEVLRDHLREMDLRVSGIQPSGCSHERKKRILSGLAHKVGKRISDSN